MALFSDLSPVDTVCTCLGSDLAEARELSWTHAGSERLATGLVLQSLAGLCRSEAFSRVDLRAKYLLRALKTDAERSDRSTHS